ncbi:MAG: hypothetical protein WC223_13100 [Bacteroidales bacterium]|jgi:hypothetical protein
MKDNKKDNKIHELLSLLPAMEYHLKQAEKIRKDIAKIKIKDLRKK